MASIDVFTTNIGDETENANTIKNVVLTKMYKDEVIDKETYNEYSENYHIIVGKYSWFKTWLSKVKDLGQEVGEKNYFYKFVKFD